MRASLLKIVWYFGGTRLNKGFPGSSDSKDSACNAGKTSSIPGLGRSPGEGNDYSLLLPGEFHGQKRLAGYSPRGCKESDMT